MPSIHPIFHAIRTDNLESVKEFLRKDPTCVNERNQTRDTPLIMSIYRCQDELVEEIFQNPYLRINLQGEDCWSAFHYRSGERESPLL